MVEKKHIEILQARIKILEKEIENYKLQIEKYKQNERKYRLFFEKSQDPFLIIKNFRFIDGNHAALRILKINSLDELLNTHPSEFSPEYQPDGKLSTLKSNEMMNLALSKGHHSFDWMHKASDGSLFFVRVSLTPIVIEDELIIFTHWTPLETKS